MANNVDRDLELVEFFRSKGHTIGIAGPAEHLNGMPAGIMLRPCYTILAGSMTFLVQPPHVTQYILTDNNPGTLWKPIKRWRTSDRHKMDILLKHILIKGVSTWKELLHGNKT